MNFPKILEYAGIYWDMLEYTGICWNILEAVIAQAVKVMIHKYLYIA
jgi:hypothetical protein